MKRELTISRAAAEAGVGVETIRFYERRGLIKQPKRPRNGGVRVYDDDIIARIRFIRQAQDIGFSLREIEELLSLRADPMADCSEVRTQALLKRDEVRRKIVQLKEMARALDALIATCPGSGALGTCTILDALATPRASKSQSTGRNTRVKKGRNMKTVTFSIEGMHCDGCARTIHALLETEAGVNNVDISFAHKTARILYDPDIVSETALKARIETAGYRALDEPQAQAK